jgi:hypothetical protein
MAILAAMVAASQFAYALINATALASGAVWRKQRGTHSHCRNIKAMLQSGRIRHCSEMP